MQLMHTQTLLQLVDYYYYFHIDINVGSNFFAALQTWTANLIYIYNCILNCSHCPQMTLQEECLQKHAAASQTSPQWPAQTQPRQERCMWFTHDLQSSCIRLLLSDFTCVSVSRFNLIYLIFSSNSRPAHIPNHYPYRRATQSKRATRELKTFKRGSQLSN